MLTSLSGCDRPVMSPGDTCAEDGEHARDARQVCPSGRDVSCELREVLVPLSLRYRAYRVVLGRLPVRCTRAPRRQAVRTHHAEQVAGGEGVRQVLSHLGLGDISRGERLAGTAIGGRHFDPPRCGAVPPPPHTLLHLYTLHRPATLLGPTTLLLQRGAAGGPPHPHTPHRLAALHRLADLGCSPARVLCTTVHLPARQHSDASLLGARRPGDVGGHGHGYGVPPPLCAPSSPSRLGFLGGA